MHLIWDALCKETPPFSLDKLQFKMNEVYSSSTFATSAFFIVILFDIKNPLRTSDAFIFPLIIAALTGFMISLSAIAPKKNKNRVSLLLQVSLNSQILNMKCFNNLNLIASHIKKPTVETVG